MTFTTWSTMFARSASVGAGPLKFGPRNGWFGIVASGFPWHESDRPQARRKMGSTSFLNDTAGVIPS